MKKTWIKIKRGLLEPKHRDRLGIRIWLYFYILDQADWDTGSVLEWRDADAADDLKMQKRTVRQQRQQLMDDGYITCELAGNKQVITIHNYINPRKYDGEVVNSKGDINLTPNSKGDIQGDIQGDIKGLSKHVTPSYKSKITNHKDIEKLGGGGFYIFNLVGFDFKDADNGMRKAISALFRKHGEYRICQLAADVVADHHDVTLSYLLSKLSKDAKDLPITPLEEQEGDYY